MYGEEIHLLTLEHLPNGRENAETLSYVEGPRECHLWPSLSPLITQAGAQSRHSNQPAKAIRVHTSPQAHTSSSHSWDCPWWHLLQLQLQAPVWFTPGTTCILSWLQLQSWLAHQGNPDRACSRDSPQSLPAQLQPTCQCGPSVPCPQVSLWLMQTC